jgi:hypothetical protein
MNAITIPESNESIRIPSVEKDKYKTNMPFQNGDGNNVSPFKQLFGGETEGPQEKHVLCGLDIKISDNREVLLEELSKLFNSRSSIHTLHDIVFMLKMSSGVEKKTGGPLLEDWKGGNLFFVRIPSTQGIVAITLCYTSSTTEVDRHSRSVMLPDIVYKVPGFWRALDVVLITSKEQFKPFVEKMQMLGWYSEKVRTFIRI